MTEHAYICLTRRCNLKCKHCLCGDPQDIDNEERHIFVFMKKLGAVKKITLTGGEPMLAPKLIKFAVETANAGICEVGCIGIVSNGHVYTDVFEDMQTQVPVNIVFSNDQFHQPNDSVVKRYMDLKVPNVSFEVREYKEHTYENLIESVRAKENGLSGRIKPSLKPNGRLTLTVRGDVVMSDILDWEMEDKAVVCSIYDGALFA